MGQGGQARVVTLDALRGVGALLVLVSHVGFWSGATADGVVGGLMARGDSGVAVFFALSAYLLGRPLLARVLEDGATAAQGARNQRWSGARYALHRAARILPAYYLALAAVVLAALALGGAAADQLSAPGVTAHLLVAQGWTGHSFQAFTQTWSLTSEVTFYLLLPLVLLPLGRLLRRAEPPVRARRLLVLLCLVAVTGVVCQAGAAAAGGSRWAGPLATSAVGHGAWFAVGLAAALVGLEPRTLPEGLRAAAETVRRSPGTAALTAALVLLVATTPLAGPRDLAAPSPAQAAAKELLYTLLAGLLLAVALGDGVDARLRRSPLAGPARLVGDLSYGVFLWHVLVLQVLFAVLGLTLFATDAAWLLVATVVLSVALAAVSWWAVERPVLSLVRRRDRARAEPPPVLVADP